MMKRTSWVAAAFALLLAGCYGSFDGFELTADDPPRAELEQMKAACEADGGSLQRAGIFATIMCITPFEDGGKACRTGADCAGACLVAEDGRYCQTAGPMFGCYSYVEDNGEVVEICVD